MQIRHRSRPALAGRGPARVLIPGLITLVGIVVAVAVMAAGCGSSSDGGDGVASASGGKTTATTVKKKDRHQSALDFARCMREHGVDMPDPTVDEDGLVKVGPGDGAGPEAAQEIDEEAIKTCGHLLGEGVQDGGGTVDPKEQDRALKFAKCMREHGVNMPDPDFSKGGISIGFDDEIDPSSPTFKEAQEACKQYFGPPGGGDPSSGGFVQRGPQ